MNPLYNPIVIKKKSLVGMPQLLTFTTTGVIILEHKESFLSRFLRNLGLPSTFLSALARVQCIQHAILVILV